MGALLLRSRHHQNEFTFHNYDGYLSFLAQEQHFAEQAALLAPHGPSNNAGSTDQGGRPPTVERVGVWSRIGAGIGVIGSAAEIGAGGLACYATGVGCLVGVPAIMHGADNLQADFRTMWTGQRVSSYTVRGLEAVGVPHAELVNGAIGIGLSLGTGAVTKTAGALVAADDGAVAAARGTTTVYRSINAAGEVQYVGITNNLARRAAEHLRGTGIQIEKLMGGLSRSDARAVEQALIEIHGLGKNGGTLLNRINSISPLSPAYRDQLARGYELLQSIGY